jgi:outer membrane protein, heavy metal efflux system
VNAGDLARQDALRLEIEAERAKGDVIGMALERRRAVLALAAVLDLDPHEQILGVRAAWPELQAVVLATDGDLRKLVEDRPDVRAAQERVAAAQVAVESAEAQKKSDVTWGVSYDHFPGTSTGLVELRMQMPLQWGYAFQGEIAKALAQRDAAESSLDKIRRAAGMELQGLRSQMQSALARSRSYEAAILPRARQVAEQAEFAYLKGALALNDLLDARRTWRATGLDALAARADYAKSATAWRLRTQPFAILLNELNQGL